jgi:hypothetical protein
MQCKNELSINQFYISNTFMMPDGRTTLCKTCVNQHIQEKGFDAVLEFLRSINKPFIADLWKEDFNDYVRQINSLPQYKNMGWENSIFNTTNRDPIQQDVVDDDVEDIDDLQIDKEVRLRWMGFSEEEMPYLEKFYQDLIAVYEHDTPIQRHIYKNIAIAQYQADKAISSGKIPEYEKLMKTISNLMNDGNIKPVQETSAMDNGLSTWGEWIKKIEETEPIPEPRDEFKDVDGIRKYIDKWFVKHFSKVFGILNDDSEIDKEMLIEESKNDGE